MNLCARVRRPADPASALNLASVQRLASVQKLAAVVVALGLAAGCGSTPPSTAPSAVSSTLPAGSIASAGTGEASQPATSSATSSASQTTGASPAPSSTPAPSSSAPIVMPAGVQYAAAAASLPTDANWSRSVVYGPDGATAFVVGSRSAARPIYLASQPHGASSRDAIRLATGKPDGTWGEQTIDDGGSVRGPSGYVLNHGARSAGIAASPKGLVIVGFGNFWTDGNYTGTQVGLSWFSTDGRSWQRTDLRSVVGSASSFAPTSVIALADGSFVMTGLRSNRTLTDNATLLVLRSADGRHWTKAGLVKGRWALGAGTLSQVGRRLLLTGLENACETGGHGALTFSVGQQVRLWTSVDGGASWKAADSSADGVITSLKPVPASARGCPKAGSSNWLGVVNESFSSKGSHLGTANGRAYFVSGDGSMISSTADFASWTKGSLAHAVAVDGTAEANASFPGAATVVADGPAVAVLSLQPRRDDQGRQMSGAGAQILSWRSTDDGATWTELPPPLPLLVHESAAMVPVPDGSVLLLDTQTVSSGTGRRVSIRQSVAGPLLPWGTCEPAPRANCAFSALSGLNLAGADLTGIDFSGATIADSDLTGANMARASLRSASITAKLGGADLSRVNAEGARISGDMTGAKVAGAVFDDGRIDPSLFAADGVASAHVVGATFSIGSSAALHGVDFGVMDLSRVSFMGFGSTLSDMRESDFRHATLSRTSFYGVDLTGARFVGRPLPAMGNAQVMFLTGLCPDGRKVTPGKAGFASCRLSPP